MKPTQGTSGKNRHRTREPSGRNRNQKLSDPSIEIKGEKKTLLTQRVTPSRRNTKYTKKCSLRSD